MMSNLDISCNMINHFIYNQKNIPKDINACNDNASVSSVTNIALVLIKPTVSTLTDSNKVGNVIENNTSTTTESTKVTIDTTESTKVTIENNTANTTKTRIMVEETQTVAA